MEALPDFEWGIISLTDGTLLAGYLHVEHDLAHHDALEVDVPAAAHSPANIAVIEPDEVLMARECTRDEVMRFVEHNAWPAPSLAYRRVDLLETDPVAQGAD